MTTRERRAYAKARYHSNPEVKRKQRESQRLRWATDPEYRKKRLQKNKAWRNQNADRIKENRTTPERRAADRLRMRSRTYGVPPEFLTSLESLQKGVCAVCGRKLPARSHVDHCHTSGKVRGILCPPCNVVEGQIRNLGMAPTEFGRRLEAYLQSPPAAVLELL